MSTDRRSSPAPALAGGRRLADIRRQLAEVVEARGPRAALCAACAIAFAVAWPVFVFEGDQTAYLVATAAVAIVAFALGGDLSPYAGVVLVGLATVVGTEARGELGAGDAPLGSLRILDVALLSAVLGAAVRSARDGTVRTLLRRRPGAIGLLVGALIVWSAVVWAADGAERNQFLNTDVRLLALAGGAYVLVRSIPRARLVVLARALVLLSPLLLLKVLLVVGLDLEAIGTNDRIQATLFDVRGDRRVVLVGGDTLLILVPALFAVLRRGADPLLRGAMAVSAVTAVLVLLMSGTRTSVLVALGLWACTAAAVSGRSLWPPSARVLSALAVGVVVLGVALSAFGVIDRFARGDSPHTGINFRFDEIRSAWSLPAREVAIGQGLAGTFVSKSVTGAEVTTAWAHVLPVWLVLKVGIAGAFVALVLLALFLRRAARARVRSHALVQTGVVVMLGLIAMSFTLGRIALPEGALFAGLASALVMGHPAREPR